jgi:hypothetical protein
MLPRDAAAKTQITEDADHVVEAVVRENRQAVALLEPHRPETQCRALNELRELRVGDAPVALDEELALTVPGGADDEFDQRFRALGEVPHRAAPNLLDP